MPIHVYIAALAVVAAVGLLAHGLVGLRSPTRAVRRNLTTSGGRVTDLREIALSRPARERMVTPLMGGLARGGRQLTPDGMLERIEQRLQLSGLAGDWPVERVLAAKLLLASSFGMAALALLVSGASSAAVFLALVLAVAGFFIPDFMLDRRARGRQVRIGRELPDVIDQVTISVEAGLGFEAALARAGQAGDGPLADELGHTLQDVRLGMPRQAAFEQLLARTDVPDLRHFVVAIGQAERHGVPIAQVLRVQADELREKRRFSAEERAMKLPVKLVFPLVLCILPALFIVLVGPAAIRIAQTPLFGQ